MKKDVHQYTDYKADDFVLDAAFRKWVLNPDKSGNIYWQDWLRSNPSKVGEIKKARELLLSIQTIDFKPNNGSQREVWKGIANGIRAKESYSPKVLPLGPHSIISHYEKSQRVGALTWGRIAATIALIITSVLAVYFMTGSSDQDIMHAENSVLIKENPLGQRSTFMMADGTKVTLNADSKLEYSSSYGKSDRTVRLEGEAFFEVAKSDELPFIVETDYLSTKALGTSFNISAYGNEGFEVSLFTGSVNVYGNNPENSQYSENLVPGERILSGINNSYQKTEFNMERHALWRNGILELHETTFKEAMITLERWYAVNIEYPEDLPGEFTFSGSFDNEYLTSVLEILGYNMNFTYQVNDKQVVITFKEE